MVSSKPTGILSAKSKTNSVERHLTAASNVFGGNERLWWREQPLLEEVAAHAHLKQRLGDQLRDEVLAHARRSVEREHFCLLFTKYLLPAAINLLRNVTFASVTCSAALNTIFLRLDR